MIPLMKNAFLNEFETKKALADFIIYTNRFSMGEKCREFETKFAQFQETNNAVLFNSGGSANLALLQALKNIGRIKENSKIGFSSLTWATNVMPIIQLGLNPEPIDCDPKTLNVMSYNLKEKLKNIDLDVFFVTNVLGFSGDLDKIKQICDENNIILIEDNCESLGTEYKSIKTGNYGIASTFSFFVAHHMSTIEGGMVCTTDNELAEMLTIVRANGWDRNLTATQQHKWRRKYNIKSEFDAKYTFYDLGYNFRPTEITGFIGTYQLQFLQNNINIREKNYRTVEKSILNNPDLINIQTTNITKLSNFSIPILCKSESIKKKYYEQFSGAGIEIRPIIAGNIQKQPFYKKYVNTKCNLQGTELIDKCGFYCGNYPELTENDIETIKSCLTKYE